MISVSVDDERIALNPYSVLLPGKSAEERHRVELIISNVLMCFPPFRLFRGFDVFFMMQS